MLDISAIRRQFPILSTPMNGRPLVYLDSAATSQKPQAVIDALANHYRYANANIHRGVYRLSEDATAAYEAARSKVAGFLGANASSIIFVRNATEGVNLVARAWGERNLGKGDVILVSTMEHHANLVPWHFVARKTGALIKEIPISDDGRLDLQVYTHLLAAGNVKLVAVTHVSNVLATINPVKLIVDAARKAGAAVLLDGAQAAAHLSVQLSVLDPDFYVVSGHKLMAPQGTGAVYVKAERFDQMDPFLGGGDMIKNVEIADSTYADPPWRYEAGTPDIAGAIGFGAAIDWIQSIGMDNIRQHEERLMAHAWERLSAIKGLDILGPKPGFDRAGSLASFTMDGAHPHDIAQELDTQGIAVRAGHHCCQPLMTRYGLMATTRASFAVHTTINEIDFLAESLEQIIGKYSVHEHVHFEPVGTVEAGFHDHMEPDDELMREVVMDHYKSPEGRAPVEGAQVEWVGKNPLCGDEVTLRMRLEDDRIADIQVLGRGCSISVASGSMLAVRMKGRTLAEAKALLDGVKQMLHGKPLPAGLDLGDAEVLRGVKDLPVRVKCALLPWTTLEESLSVTGADNGTKSN